MKTSKVVALTRAAYNQGHRAGHKEGRDMQAQTDVDGFTRNIETANHLLQQKAAEVERLTRDRDHYRDRFQTAHEHRLEEVRAEAVTVTEDRDRAQQEVRELAVHLHEAEAERDSLRERVAYLEAQETYTASCDQCEAVRRLESTRGRLETDVAALTQKLADSLSHAVTLTRERDEARTETAGYLAALDTANADIQAQAVTIRDQRQRVSKADEQCERLKGLVCQLDKWAKLGRTLEALPLMSVVMRTTLGPEWTVTLPNGGKHARYTLQKALDATGVVPDYCDTDEDAAGQEMEGTT